MRDNGSAPYVISPPPDYHSVSSLDNQHNYLMINYYAPLLHPLLSDVTVLRNSAGSTAVYCRGPHAASTHPEF